MKFQDIFKEGKSKIDPIDKKMKEQKFMTPEENNKRLEKENLSHLSKIQQKTHKMLSRCDYCEYFNNTQDYDEYFIKKETANCSFFERDVNKDSYCKKWYIITTPWKRVKVKKAVENLK